VDISNAETAQAEKARSTQFRQGDTIPNLIEKIIKKSDWAKEQATAESDNGVNTWFKIDTQVFLDKNPNAERQTGSSPKIYVYSIIKYYPDEAKQIGTCQRPKNTEQLKAIAPKEYNYFYTGKNEDVLNFDIKFNNQFFMTAFGNFGQNSATTATGGGNSATAIIVRVKTNDNRISVLNVAAEPFDLVRIDVRCRYFNRGRKIEDNWPLDSRLPHTRDSITNLNSKIDFGAGKALRRILEGPLCFRSKLRTAFNFLRTSHGDLYDTCLVCLEDFFSLHYGGGIIDVKDSLLCAFQRLESSLY
jgi:hypothetical protein